MAAYNFGSILAWARGNKQTYWPNYWTKGDIEEKPTTTQIPFGALFCDINYNILFQGRAVALLGSDFEKLSVSLCIRWPYCVNLAAIYVLIKGEHWLRDIFRI